MGIDVGRQWAGGTLIYQLIPPQEKFFSGSYGHIGINLPTHTLPFSSSSGSYGHIVHVQSEDPYNRAYYKLVPEKYIIKGLFFNGPTIVSQLLVLL